jgi:hypothetical protein
MAYHVSPNGPSLCHAKQGRCPYGADGENHFATVSQATEFYEKKMSDAFGDFETVKKTGKQKRKEKAYTYRDRFIAVGRAVKTSPQVLQAVKEVKALKDAPLATVARVQALKTKAWKGFSKVATTTRRVSADVATEASKARARYNAYAVRVSAENKIKILQYHADILDATATRYEAKSAQLELGGKLRAETADKLVPGDKLENGITVAKLKVVDGATVITTRNPTTGRFGKTITVPAGEKISVVRPRRQLARQAGEAYKTVRTAAVQRTAATANSVQLKSRGAFAELKGRATYAAALQRQSFEAIRGVDRQMIQNRQPVAVEDPVRDVRSLNEFRPAA